MKKQNRNDFFKQFKIEEDYHRSPKQRALHIICFVTPVITAFLGYFLSYPVWNHFSQKEIPEIFKFAFSVVFFAIPIVIIFVKTRNTNPTMRIRVSDKVDNKDISE